MSLPLARDINPFGDLDCRKAAEHFLGKTHDEAIELFEENFIYYQGDLMFMGVVTFCFYLPAAVQYAESDHAKYCDLTQSCLLSLLEYRWQYEQADLEVVRNVMLQYCQGVIDRIEKVGADHLIAGLEYRFRRFIETLTSDVKE